MNKQKKEAEKKEHKNKKDQKEKEKEEVEKKSKEPKKKKGKKKKGRNQVKCQKTFFLASLQEASNSFVLIFAGQGKGEEEEEEEEKAGGGELVRMRWKPGEEMKIAIIAIHDWTQVMSAPPFPIKTLIQLGKQQ